jgi:hypothetical protein
VQATASISFFTFSFQSTKDNSRNNATNTSLFCSLRSRNHKAQIDVKVKYLPTNPHQMAHMKRLPSTSCLHFYRAPTVTSSPTSAEILSFAAFFVL